MYQRLQPNRRHNMFDMNTAGEESLCCDNLKPKHGLKPFKKNCISLLFMVVGSWQAPGVTKGMKSGLDLGISHNSNTVRIDLLVLVCSQNRLIKLDRVRNINGLEDLKQDSCSLICFMS